MRGALGRDRKPSRLAAGKRLLLGAAALSALILPDAASSVAWGQASATLPEVTVTAPRPAPTPARRVARGTAKPAQTPPAGAAPAATSALPAFRSEEHTSELQALRH